MQFSIVQHVPGMRGSLLLLSCSLQPPVSRYKDEGAALAALANDSSWPKVQVRADVPRPPQGVLQEVPV